MSSPSKALNPKKLVKDMLDPKKSFKSTEYLYGKGGALYDPAGVISGDSGSLAGGVFGESGKVASDPMGLFEGEPDTSVTGGDIKAAQGVNTAEAAARAEYLRKQQRARTGQGRASTMLTTGQTGTSKLLGG